LVQSKGFSSQALDPVAGHRGAEGAGRDGQTQARTTCPVRQH
jgi:hypothetical protein